MEDKISKLINEYKLYYCVECGKCVAGCPMNVIYDDFSYSFCSRGIIRKAMLEQDLDVEALIFTTPFCLCDKCNTSSVIQKFGIKAYTFVLGQEYLDLVTDPPHGHGSQMNPCLDCRIMMMKKAKELAQKMGAKCIVTGEVLDERPFSQTRQSM